MKNLTAFLKKISEITGKYVDITDKAGYIMYSSDSSRVGNVCSDTDTVPVDGKHRMYIHIENGSCEENSLAQLILKDRFFEGTADNYQQFLINILDGFEVNQEGCKKFNIPCDGKYIVYIIRLFDERHLSDAYSLIRNSFSDDCEWVFEYNGSIILVRNTDEFSDKVRQDAKTIKDMINSEVYTDIHIGIGDIHDTLRGVRDSFREAEEAVRIGKLFNLPDRIYLYNEILTERIVSLIPAENAGKVFDEVFRDGVDELLDGDMVKTIEVLFKNNLNISDSARILYIHRNTLLYRLDKIQKATGLDIRKFDDAVIFRLILLLRQVIKSGNKIDAKS